MLTTEQVTTIHHNALRVLAEIGVKVEHPAVRARLAAIGGTCTGVDEQVRFAPPVTERHIADAPKTPMRAGPPSISVHSGVYQSLYLDPDTGSYELFDEARLAAYITLARHLPLMAGVGLLGVPFIPAGIPAIPATHLPLAERLYAWKYGAVPGGSVHFTGLCEPLLELCACHAQATGGSLASAFNAVGYLISPLKLARPECEQLLFFAERGLHMGIGHLPSQGGTAPVTLAGALTLALAEQIFLFLLQRAFWQDAAFSVGGSVSTMDMRQAVSCYGRPEQQRINVACADIASFYGCACGGHTGLTDAKVPSCEAGAQKATGALMTALATGHGSIEAGLLGIDEVCSPLQMVLDVDIARSLIALLAAPTIDDVECAFDEIRAAGVGGHHLGSDFTVERHRAALFQPYTWAYQSQSGWEAGGRWVDVDMAREQVHELLRQHPPGSLMSEGEERDLRRIIDTSVRRRTAPTMLHT
ncbi:MAG: trimethylamine methyltransferase family protein [Chloroflexi bacterium]|nr:trimethylamine methyltransferase family protein [Chloroflexota bacterium]